MTPQDLFSTKALESIGSSATFSIREKDKGLIKKDQVLEVLNINLDAAKFGSIVELKALSKVAAISSDNVKPKQISNQILAEPIKSFSQDALVGDKLGANATIATNVVTQTQENIEKLSALSQNPNQINNKDINACLKAAGKKCATISEVESKQADFANGHIVHAGSVSTTVAGNGVNIHSDTSLTTRSPYISTNTQDFHVQANNSAVILSDLEIRQSKQAVNLVEGTSVQQSQFSLQVASESQDNIAKQYRSIGTDTHVSMGTNTQVVADKELSQLSGGNIQVAAYESISTQAAKDISIVASPSPNIGDSKPNASGEKGSTNSKASSITIVSSNGKDKTNLIQLSEAGSLNSSTGHNVTSAAKSAVMSGIEAVASISTSYAFMGSQTGGLIVKGGRIFVNSIPSTIPAIKPPSVLQLPKLPSIPQVSKTDLSKCLPKRTQDQQSPTGNSPGTNGNNSSDKSQKIPSVPTLKGKPLNNQKQRARVLDGEKTTPVSASNSASSKLPGVTISQAGSASSNQSAAITGSTPNAVLDTSAASGASFNIYLDCSQTRSNALEFVSSLDFINAQEFKIDDTVVFQALTQESLSKLIGLSNSLIKGKLGSIVPPEVLSQLQRPEIWQALSKLNQKKISEQTVSTLDAEPAELEKIKQIIKAYPTAIAPLEEILEILYTLPAVGFLGAISSLFSNLKLPIGLIEKGIQLPSIIASGDTYKAIQTGASIISQVTGNSTFSNLVNNSDLASIGSALFAQDSNKLQQTINDAIKRRVLSVLPANLQTHIGAIESVISNIQLGKPIKEEEIVALLSQQLGSVGNALSVAKGIYDKAVPVFNDLAQGNLSKLLTNQDLPSLLSALGPVGSQISKVIDVVNQSIGLIDTIKLIPDLIKMMNEFKIPALNQIGIALSCLDLFKKINSLLNSVKGVFNSGASGLDAPSNTFSTKDTTRFLESAGRLTQGFNSVKNIDPDLIDSSSEIISLVEELKELELPIDLDPCFKLPKLTLEQSLIEVISLNFGQLTFSLKNKELLDLEVLPGKGDEIQLRIESFIDIESGDFLQAYQTEFQYTPSIYNFIISKFDYELNQGVAFIDGALSEIILQSTDGILYEYSTGSIGERLTPFILDSYLLA